MQNYSKEFEKIVLTGRVEEALKNLVPGSLEELFILFNEELKKCLNSKAITDELNRIMKAIQDKEENLFKECEVRKFLLEYDLPSTSEERKKEIVDYLKKRFCNLNFDYEKPSMASDLKSVDTNQEKYPTELTEEVFKKALSNSTGKRDEIEKFRKMSDKEKVNFLTELVNQSKAKLLYDILQQVEFNFYLMNDDTFQKLFTLLNKEKKVSLPFYYEKITSSQLNILIKTVDDSLIDKNNLFDILISKKYSKDLDLAKNNLKKKKEILLKIYAEVKDQKSLVGYRASLLSKILTLSIELNEYDLNLFLAYLDNPMHLSDTHLLVRNPQKPEQNTRTFFSDCDSNGDLMKKYLRHFFLYDSTITTKTFENYIEQNFLMAEYITAKILKGEENYSEAISRFISKSKYEELCKKTEVTICPHNKKNFEVDEKVEIDLDIKNVKVLTLDIFEINTENYYLEKNAPMSSTIIVEGLVTSSQDVYTFNEKSQKLIRKTITLDKIPNRRGVFLIEVLGNGISSRIIIKKGVLDLITTTTSKGKLCYIINEKGEIMKGENTYLYYNKIKYTSNNEGMILVPFKAFNEKEDFVIISSDGFSEFSKFDFRSERYSLRAEFYINHESIVTGNIAKCLVKPVLLCCDKNILLSNMKSKLTVRIYKKENDETIPIDTPFENIVFNEKGEFEFEVNIPPMIESLEFTLEGELMNSQNKKEKLVCSHQEKIDNRRDETVSSFLRTVSRPDGDVDYILEILGRNGEIIQNQFVLIKFCLENGDDLDIRMEPDSNGKIHLHNLHAKGVQEIQVSLKRSANAKRFIIDEKTKFSYPFEIDVVSEDEVTLPFYGNQEDIKVVKVNSNKSIDEVVDNSKHIKFSQMNINGDKRYYEVKIHSLKQGQYIINLNKNKIDLFVHNGKYWFGNEFIFSKEENQIIENNQIKTPIYLTDLNIDKSSNKIRFKSTSSMDQKDQHAHVILYNYLPNDTHEYFDKIKKAIMDNIELKSEKNFSKWKNIYLSNRILNEEIQYVLQRKNYDSMMGNSLEMPSLLLKRQYNKKSKVDEEKINKGETYKKMDADVDQKKKKKKCHEPTRFEQAKNVYSDFQNFIKYTSYIVTNVKPENGEYVIEIPKEKAEINKYSEVQVILMNEKSISDNVFALHDEKENFSVDKRSITNEKKLDESKNYTEIRKTELCMHDKEFKINETSNYKILDSIQKVIDYMVVKNSNKFSNNWDKILNIYDEKKFMNQYSQNSSHEMNIFLYFKYPEIFNKKVKPILAYKFEKSFIDYFLLGNNEVLMQYAKPEKVQSLNTFELCLLILSVVKTNPELAKKLRNVVYSRVKLDKIESVCIRNFDIMMNMKNDNAKSEEDSEDESSDKKKGGAAVEEEDVELDACQCEAAMDNLDGGVDDRDMFCSMGMASALSNTLGPTSSRHGMPLQAPQQMEAPMMAPMAAPMMMTQAQFCAPRMLKQSNVLFNRKLEETKEFKGAVSQSMKTTSEYNKPGQVKEYEERHYLFPLNERELLVSPIWLDFADHILKYQTYKNFLSKYILFDQQNITEVIWILSVLDLPLKSKKHSYTHLPETREINFKVSSNVILFTKELSEGNLNIDNKILVSQNIASKNGEEVDINNLVKREIYNHETIVTNISSKKIEFDIFIQIPEGSIPTDNTYYSQIHHMILGAYATSSYGTSFYFPESGKYKQYHPLASKEKDIIALGESLEYNVKDKFVFEEKKNENTDIIYNKDKLKQILSRGNKDEILSYFKTEPFIEQDIRLILWLLKDKDFFLSLVNAFRQRGFYSEQVWSFAFYHYDPPSIKECLSTKHELNTIFSSYSSSLYERNCVGDAKFFNHLEYAPMLNARTHPIGKSEVQIQNTDFRKTYEKFIISLLKMNEIDLRSQLRLVYYLILQERINEANDVFKKINKDAITTNNKDNSYEIQYDYLSAYLDFSLGYPNFDIAKGLCKKYSNFPLLEWRERFNEIKDQLFEYEGKEIVPYSSIDLEALGLEDEEEKQKLLIKKLKESEPSLEFKIENKTLNILHSNIKEIHIKFYCLDLETLFSICPSFKNKSENFSFVQPNYSTVLKVEENKSTIGKGITFEIPKEYVTKNLFIEVSSLNFKKFETYFSANINVKICENLGELQVTDKEGKSIPKAYTKVFVKRTDREAEFYKDGYTDLRGKFNYLALNTNQLKDAEKFYIFVSDENLGSTINECNPPSNLSYEGIQEKRQKARIHWRYQNKLA